MRFRQGAPELQPDGMPDDLKREPETLVRNRSQRGSVLAAKASVEKGQCETHSTSERILRLGELPPTAVVLPR